MLFSYQMTSKQFHCGVKQQEIMKRGLCNGYVNHMQFSLIMHVILLQDYHVIFLHHGKAGCLVYDLDTTLPFPCAFDEYQSQTFKKDEILNPKFRRYILPPSYCWKIFINDILYRYFRVVSAQEYLQTFASDRRHMKKLGLWIKPPPSYDPIKTPESNHNLDKFICMNSNEGPGKVMSCKQFVERFRKEQPDNNDA